MIVWVNGPFGAGKTSVVRALHGSVPSSVVFDPEVIGFALRPALADVQPVTDFQEWRAWRRLTVSALTEIAEATDCCILVPQTVLVESYWDEIMAGLTTAGLEVTAVTLDVEPSEHLRRIEHDQVEHGAVEWRRARRADYESALEWLSRKSTVVDTTSVKPEEIARALAARFGLSRDRAPR